MKLRSKWLKGVSAAALLSQTAYLGAATQDVEPRVKDTLQKMVGYLESMKNLSFTATTSTEDVSSTLQKLQFDTTLEGVIQRPNKVYFKKSGSEQMSLWFDGQTVTILDRKANKYAKVAVNGDLQDLVNRLDALGIEAPLAGLLNRGILMHVEDHVFKGDYYGLADVDGTSTEHLAFRQDAVDWQLWTNTATGAPKKLVITSKMLAGAPEHSLLIKEATINQTSLDANLFQAKIPGDATEVPLQISGSGSINHSEW